MPRIALSKRCRNTICILAFSFVFAGLFILLNSCSKKAEVKVGVILPLTGDLASYGQMAEKGIRIAFQNWKNKTDFVINPVFEDNQSSVKGALNAEHKLIYIEKVPVIIGGIASSIAMAMVPEANKNKVVLMCAFASSPRLTDAGEYIYRVMPSDAFQGILTARWFADLQYKRVAVIYEQNDWGVALFEAFKDAFIGLRGDIECTEQVLEGQKDFKTTLAKLRECLKKVDAVYLPTYPKEGGVLLRQLREAGLVDKPIFGADPWANKEILSIAGPAAEGTMFMAPLQYEGPEYNSFKEKFISKYQENPDLTASAGYDAANIILEVMNRIKRDGKDITGALIKQYLGEVSGYVGATGVTTFDENGDVVSKEFSKRVIRNGNIIALQEVK